MSDQESDNDVSLPPREVCEERCQEFAAVTGTDTALAMFFLQDRNWHLETALNAYFESNDSPASSSTAATSAAVNVDATTKSTTQEEQQSHRIRILSWNIDGLDENSVRNRTLGVCKTILVEDPDVVYLQEVIPSTLSLLQEKCPQYHVVPGGSDGYFTAMMLKATSVTVKEHKVLPFNTSVMMRNLLRVEASVKNVDCTLLTSHLESTKEHHTERKKQLRLAFKEMQEVVAGNTVIFGGDLNMRDKELSSIGGMPDNTYDVWEVTGKRPEAQFTWDLSRNDNLEWTAKFRPKCRFDRLYIRHSKPRPKLKPVYFELVGLQRLNSCSRFPSDHWGILAHFDKTEGS